jgi:hypothetical protein
MIGGRCWSDLTAAELSSLRQLLDIQRCAPRDNLSDANERVTKLRNPELGARLPDPATAAHLAPYKIHNMYIQEWRRRSNAATGRRVISFIWRLTHKLLLEMKETKATRSPMRPYIGSHKRPHKRSFTSFA